MTSVKELNEKMEQALASKDFKGAAELQEQIDALQDSKAEVFNKPLNKAQARKQLGASFPDDLSDEVVVTLPEDGEYRIIIKPNAKGKKHISGESDGIANLEDFGTEGLKRLRCSDDSVIYGFAVERLVICPTLQWYLKGSFSDASYELTIKGKKGTHTV